MKKSEKIISYIFLSLLIIINMFQNSLYFSISQNIENIIDLMAYLYIIILIFKYLKIKKNKTIFIAILSISILYTGYITSNLTFLSSLVYMMFIAISNEKDVLRYSTKIIEIVLAIHVFIYIVQILMGHINIISDFSGRARYKLGFTSPNTSGIYFLWILVAKVYLNDYSFKKTYKFLFIVFIAYVFNQSRTMLTCSIVLIILMIMIKNKRYESILRLVARNIILFFSIMVLGLSVLYIKDVNLVKKIDEISSHRIFFSAKAIESYGITVFGKKTDHIKVNIDYYSGIIITDVTYIALIYRYGIFYILVLCILSRYITKTRSINEYILIILYAIFALFEIYSLNFLICFPMVFGAKWIGENKNDTEIN